MSDDMWIEFVAGHCLLCDKVVLANTAYGPKDAGAISMGFGYGSHAHDTLGYDGFICDQCAMPFREEMLAQTIVRMQKARAQMIADGVQFGDAKDLENL